VKVPELSQSAFKQTLIDHILDTPTIEQEFSKLHLLIDKLFQNEEDLAS